MAQAASSKLLDRTDQGTHFRIGRAGLSSVGEGDVGAERDHAEAGSDALAAAEAHTAPEFALEGSGKDNDEKIGGGIEEHRESTKNHELQENVAAFGRDELRNEGKEKQSGLGVENFGENALTKGAGRGGLRSADSPFLIPRANHADAEPDEICSARVLDGVEGYGGSSEDRRDAEGGSEDVEKSTDKSAERRKHAFRTASGKAAR